MKLAVGTYGNSWYTAEFNGSGFSNLEAHDGRDFSCIRYSNGGLYAVTENSDAGPCFLTPVVGTEYFIASNFGNGSADLFVAGGEDKCGVTHISPLEKRAGLQFRGSGPVMEKGRQIHSRVHQVSQIPWKIDGADDGLRLFLATDFGSDAIRVLSLGREFDTLSQYMIKTPAGSGPRHMAFLNRCRLLYCLCEISNELLVYSLGSFNEIELLQSLNISKPGVEGTGLGAAAGDVLMHPSGRWLYVTRRIEGEGVLKFEVGEDGFLSFSSFVPSGRHPRSLCLVNVPERVDAGGLLFVSCKDEAVQVFSLDAMGNLAGEIFRLELPCGDMPVWVEPLLD